MFKILLLTPSCKTTKSSCLYPQSSTWQYQSDTQCQGLTSYTLYVGSDSSGGAGSPEAGAAPVAGPEAVGLCPGHG